MKTVLREYRVKSRIQEEDHPQGLEGLARCGNNRTVEFA
jgi:hypothetical protein